MNDVVENLHRRNPFMSKAFNGDQFVLDGKVVHIPQAGTQTDAQRNRTSFPATVRTRSESDITFALDSFTMDPVKVANLEKIELSFDKRRSVIGNHNDYLAQLVGDWMLYNWAPTAAGNIIRTTGGSVAAHIGTGTRKLILEAELKKAALYMNRAGIPMNDRYIQFDADLYDQFLTALGSTTYKDFSRYMDAANGIVGKLHGFTFLEPRPSVLRYASDASAVNTPDAAGADTDQAGIIAWQLDQVIKALGSTKIYDNTDRAEYYGDVISAEVRAGGRKMRSDGAGVIAIVQDTFV